MVDVSPILYIIFILLSYILLKRCPPCRAIKPFFEELATKNREIFFIKVNIDNFPLITEEAGVLSMPTFIVYINGNKKISMEGANRLGLERLVEASYMYEENQNNEPSDTENSKKPSFIAPVYTSNEEKSKKRCCTIS
jgi:thiol-disulfide isomerase/thioredoxin